MNVVENQAPTANAGPDTSVIDTDASYQPTAITLDGRASSDPESAPLTHSWTQIGGPPVPLTGANTATPTFSAPVLQNQTPALLTFRLSVSDGKTTRTDDVTITVTHNNRPPTALATAPATVPEGTPVTLDGSASNDPDYDTLTYTWTQTFGTPVSLAQNGTNNPTIQFTTGIDAPHSVLGEELKFTLTVSDGISIGTSAPVSVFISNVNQAPIVTAGDDDVVFDTVGEVGIHGHTQDPDGDTLSFQWVQIGGPHVDIKHADEDHAHVVIPAVSPEQGSITLTFQLIATDGNDAAAISSTSNPVNITVRHANRAPVADAGLSRNVPEQSVVTLDASGSYDPDADAIASHSWTQISGNPVTLDLTNPAAPTFTAPDVNSNGETLAFELVVNDTPAAGSGASLSSAPSTVTISVTYVNRPPVAIASAPASADEGSVVTLNGSASDPDGNATSLVWAQVSGPSVTLSDATSATPTFIAPEVDRFGDTVVFSLVATDEFNASSAPAAVAAAPSAAPSAAPADTASVAILNVNHAPNADAGLTQSVPEDTPVSLAGLGSDQDREEQLQLTYAWTQTAGPAVVLTGADTLYPSFQAPIVTAGGDPEAMVTLKFELTVTDPNSAPAIDDVEIIVTNVDHAPIANAGGIYNANEATAVTLDGSLSNDPDGDLLTHTWVQTAGPAVVLTNANSATPSFTAPFVTAAGATLKFKLTVSDGFDGSSSDIATVNVRNANDPPTITGASPSIAMLWPPNHNMVPVSIAGVVDPNGNSIITITGVTQDEPTNGLGDGDTAVDAIINADGTVLLRSERSGKGDGRVYRVHYTASDLEGSVSGMVKVGVPHSKKTDPLRDSGGVFDSTH